MRKNNCEIVRRELDELMLEERCSSAALEHLQQCSDCREFQRSQTKLRQMVGSVGTVVAPADFDFRLRARLANDSSSSAFHLRSVSWIFARRGLALAALLLFIATGVVVVRNVINPQDVNQAANKNDRTVSPEPQPTTVVAPKPREEMLPVEEQAKVPENGTRNRSERSLQAGVRPRRNIVSEDFSGLGAEVINGPDRASGSEVFPIDASLESFKVSLDDGRGNPRTISLPTIRFGSQRMLPSGNQYTAKGVW